MKQFMDEDFILSTDTAKNFFTTMQKKHRFWTITAIWSQRR